MGFILILSLAFFVFPDEKQHKPINIGVPDDSSSYLFHYLIEEKGLEGELSTMLGVYSIKNCCTSTSQWALSTNNIDMAVICPDAAIKLLAKDKRYSIVGACMVNSDILVLRSESKVETIGTTQNRDYQEELIHNLWGRDVRVLPMLGNALPFVYNEKKIDGVVVDISSALRMEGTKQALRDNNRDTVTYVLVVRQDYLQKDGFQEFINLYNEMVEELNDEELLQIIVNKYAGYVCSGKEASEWKRMNVRYLPLTIPGIS